METKSSYFKLKENKLITQGVFEFFREENLIILYDSMNKIDIKLNLEEILKFKIDPNELTFYIEEITIQFKFNKHDSSERILYNAIISALRLLEIKRQMLDKTLKKLKKFIIKEPKDFQFETLKFAKDNNTIVFLETGLGKTYIAIMLLKEIFGEPLNVNFINRITYKRKSPKKALFLCKTIGLLIQQAKVLKYNTSLKIFKLYGKIN